MNFLNFDLLLLLLFLIGKDEDYLEDKTLIQKVIEIITVYYFHFLIIFNQQY